MLFSFYWILYLGTSALIWTTAQARSRLSHNIVKRELDNFERDYINSLRFKLHNETVKLIGYMKVKIPLEEVDDFEDHYFTNYAEFQKLNFNFYDQASMELRIYFQVAGALIEHKGSIIEANEHGEFEIKDVDGDCAVLGRKQTNHIHGIKRNIIKDGVIYLADRAYPTHKIGNVFVYNFGYKRRDKSCLENHGGVNCSDKYNIHQGRCPENHKRCMDYNGYGTDCSGSKIYFTGSDCSISMSMGHCWSEAVAHD
ncbi:hypothetical protein RclHR1_01880004 [Rhizophagus clarus]|uniref:DDE Tnp4 domain-containing protein n=1 Tax=Rhizophagus clarus TaxID=94130 RepID=A0A2Z6QMF6_9GLOM|nr:hypothetical protein RclHR1_01880004 [Rhizophagus clarus]GES90243.1 hypothetical protein GLOIN_2v1458907 [Rhizophagus clarus]